MNIQTIAENTPQHVKRWGGWWVGAVGLVAVIGLIADEQLEVMAYKVALVCVGQLLSYVADRTIFSNAPEVSYEMSGEVAAARLHARALIFLGVMIGITVGI
jgi:hypothetical protein